MIEWFKQQPDTFSQPEMGDIQTLDFCQTIEVNHIKIDPLFSPFYTTLFVSESSGLIGIASTESKPSLSVMFPGTDKFPLILSEDEGYSSALFMSLSGQEHLAAASEGKIQLWNMVQNTQSVVCELANVSLWSLCAIDERTIACRGEEPSSDGSSKIYIMEADSEKFTFSGTIQLKASDKITDICFVKISDGTACLLLSFHSGSLVQCVEMIGGKVRWKADQEQMGESFVPWSICTDGSTVFVVTAGESKLQLLSVEDELLLTSIYLRPYGIVYPTSVRLQGLHLFLGHLNEKQDTYCISKFIKPQLV